MRHSRMMVATTALLIAADSRGPMPPPLPLPLAHVNDNRVGAGRTTRDTLHLRLVVQLATWHPEGDSGPGIAVAAFGEEGKAPEIPAPLLRVPTGAVIEVSVRNGLTDSAITIHGLATHPAQPRDSLVLRAGDSVTVRFAAGAPGTYLYRASVGRYISLPRQDERETAGGAFIVDPIGRVPADRIFVMNIWGHRVDSTRYSNALAINGRSWPFDERVRATVGDTLRWRWINASGRSHPMHLHGFYYQIDSRGSALNDSTYPPGARRTVVTQTMAPFTTMAMTFSPTRPGNWLFHCHLAYHVVAETARIEAPAPGNHDAMSTDPERHMAGLVVGITVAAPPAWRASPRPHPRTLRLFIQEGKRRARAPRALGFVLQRGSTAPAADSVEKLGSMLVLRRGEPTDIEVINRLHEPSAVHWHGIELESWSDGVAGWSGAPGATAPSIAPGDSFVAHLTLPRAGTFIYHTHMNDIEQLGSGLYGAIVVLDRGQRFDDAVDHVFVIGSDGPGDHRLVNGDSVAPPLVMAGARTHRMRFINIGAYGRFAVTIMQDSVPVTWRALAKDGADLPPSQATSRRSEQMIDVGETFDFAWQPRPGAYVLSAGVQGGTPFYRRRIVITSAPASQPTGRPQ